MTHKHAEEEHRLAATAENQKRALAAQHKAAPNGLTDETIDKVMEFLPKLRAEGTLFLQDLIALAEVLKTYPASVPEATRILAFMAEDIKPVADDIDKLLALLHPTPLPLPLQRKVK